MAPPAPSTHRERCAAHDLACGPDGMCALCHRASAPRSSMAGVAMIAAALFALALTIAGAVAVRGAQAARAFATAQAEAAAKAAPEQTVRLYTTSWCPHCARAKQWLKSRRVDFVELDVEHDAWASREHRRLNPGGGIPTLDAAGEVVRGFSEEGYRSALLKSGRLDELK